MAIPRRIDTKQWTEEEKMIASAIAAVEKLGADPRLTKAVVLLSDAQSALADYVDALSRKNHPVEIPTSPDASDLLSAIGALPSDIDPQLIAILEAIARWISQHDFDPNTD